MMAATTERIDRWIHGLFPADAEGLALSRIFYASYFLIVGIPTFSWASANPPGFFDPPPLSLAALFSGFPPYPLLRGLDLLICVLLVCVLVGFKTRSASFLLTAAWIFGNSFRFSFGKIDHSIIVLITPAVLALAGWGESLSMDARARRRTGAAPRTRAWPLSLLTLFIGFGFLSAGIPKFLVWFDLDLGTQGARSWLVSGWYGLGRHDLLAPYFIEVSSPWFWEMLDVTAVAFEIGFFLSIASRFSFRAFIFIAVFFHVANLLMLNIGFLTLLPVYVIFAPWERMGEEARERVRAIFGRFARPATMGVLLAAFLPLYLLSDRLSVDTNANAFSHLGIAAELAGGVDFNWGVCLVAFPAAAVVALWLAGMPLVVGRFDPPARANGRAVVFFDGVCNLCNGAVDFLIRRDRDARLMYASLQSDVGQRLLGAHEGRAVDAAEATMLFVDAQGRVFERSDAVLKALATIPGVIGGSARLALVVPRAIRDVVYRIVAGHRYRILGRRDSCRIPTEAERASFLA